MTQLQKPQLEQLVELAEQVRRERQETIDQRVLCWLALLPEWTWELAKACRFPESEGDLEKLLRRAERTGICTVRRVEREGEPAVRFWMPNAVRTRLFEDWQRGGGPNLRGEVATIAAYIKAVHGEGAVEISPGVLRWAELALGELEASFIKGEVLSRKVERALESGDSVAAAEWIFAGDSLSFVLGAEMKLAAGRARRRLDLHYRRLQDKRYLAEFVKREEQIEEIRGLLASTKNWIVHFIGQSGVGKTMLMRYLTASLPDADPYAFAARIDFDYIDPRFPLEAPARLLQELGEELAVNLQDPDQEETYRSFREAVTRIEAADLDPHEPLDSWEFEEVISTFAEFVKTLPEPVVLILDTCEELAKLYPAGEDVPSIRAMFDILNLVHAAAPDVRVVLAGRRWLTPKAANKVRGLAMPPAVEQMEPRTYMRMHAVRGFTRREVIEYLRDIRKLDPDEDLIKAILENTFDPGMAASWDEGTHGPMERPRYNPSDVALFAGWIEKDPTLSAEDLSGGNRDPYVEIRIFKRIQSKPVLAAIPAATLLERFDAETIAPALEGDSRMQSRAIDGLIEQEWTHLEDGPGSRGMLISVDGGLLRRLNDFYDRTPDRKHELEQARALLIPHLVQMFKRPTAEVPPDRIDSAVRALPIEETLPLLDEMSERVVKEPAWPWAEAVGRLLLSRERQPRLPDPLLAPVRALYTAALTHRRSSVDLGEMWKAVVEKAAEHPDEQKAKTLEARGHLGALRAAVGNGGVDPMLARDVLGDGRRMLHRQSLAEEVAPGLLATVEAIVDAREGRSRPMPVQAVGECLTALMEHFKGDDPVWFYLLALEGRAKALTGDWDGAREAFERFEDAGGPDPDADPRFADWVPPDSIEHRSLLELLRFRLADRSESPELLDRCEWSAMERRSGADGAQLLSLTLQARLASGEVDAIDVERVDRFEQWVSGYSSTAPAHRVAPPLFVSLAEAWMAAGRPARALKLLSEREEAAAARRTDEDSATAAAVATARILRALRSHDRLGLIAGLSGADDDPELRGEALAAGALIAGIRASQVSEFDSDHATWMARSFLGREPDEEALEEKRLSRPQARGSAAVHLALDRFEAELIHRRLGSGFKGIRFMRAAAAARAAVAEARAEPSIAKPLGQESLRLALRSRVILGDTAWPIEPRRMRQVGRLALEEGEMLALRLPHRSIQLLDFAEKCLDQAGDRYGAFCAALRGAIAEIHAGKPEEARARLGDIVDRFEAIRRDQERLPSLDALLAGAADDVPEEDPDLWPEWTRRLVNYLRWCNDPDSVRGRYSFEGHPELALMPAAGAPGATQSGDRGELWFTGVAFLVAAIVGAVFGLSFGDLLDHDPVLVVGTAFAASIAAAFLGDRLTRWIPRAILPVQMFDVVISFAPRWPKGGEMAKALVNPRTPGWIVRNYFRFWRRVKPNARWEALISPLASGEERRPPGALALAVRPRVGGEYTPIRLLVSPSLAHVGWEWRLAGHLARQRDWYPDAMPPIWRGRPAGSFVLPPADLPPRLAGVCSPQWWPFVESVSPQEVEWLPASEEGRARAAVALGSPVMTRAGWRLRLDDDLAGGMEEVDRHRTQRLLSADRLARKAPVAIVVARPGGWRVTDDQRTAEGLRGFANEVFLAGAHAVIVIPQLPPEMTARTIGMLTGEIYSWLQIPDTRQLLDLTERLRWEIFRPWGLVDEQERNGVLERKLLARLALDACLFAP